MSDRPDDRRPENQPHGAADGRAGGSDSYSDPYGARFGEGGQTRDTYGSGTGFGGYGQSGGHGGSGFGGAGGYGGGPGARLFDDLARLVTDAAGATQGVRREVETAMRAQAESVLGRLDVVRRDEFEAMAEVARRARAEADALRARVEALEARFGAGGMDDPQKN